MRNTKSLYSNVLTEVDNGTPGDSFLTQVDSKGAAERPATRITEATRSTAITRDGHRTRVDLRLTQVDSGRR